MTPIVRHVIRWRGLNLGRSPDRLYHSQQSRYNMSYTRALGLGPAISRTAFSARFGEF